MFTGEYRHTVDDKGRIAVPAKFRVQLGAGAVVSRWLDACLAIHTQAGWDEPRDQGRGPAHHGQRLAPLPAIRVRRRGRGRTRPAGADPAAGAICATRSASARRPWSSVLAITRRSGSRPRGRPTARHSTTRRSWPRPSRAWGSSSGPHALPGSARDPIDDGGGEMEAGHIPVLAEEVLTMLAPAPGSLQIDATLGGGGHTERILEATDPDGRLLGLDADGAAIARVAGRLRPRFGDRLVLRQANFRELASVAPGGRLRRRSTVRSSTSGLSSYQLADTDRGFGFRAGGPLDMRFDTQPRRAGRRAARDARRRRARRPLPPLRRGAQGRSDRPRRSSTPAGPRRSPRPRTWPPSSSGSRRRIRVSPAGPTRRRASSRRCGSRSTRNSMPCSSGLAAALDLLRPGGRLVVLSYHSLEDRIVKRFFAAERRGCVCPPELPVCVCGRNPRLRLVTRPSLTPRRPRSRPTHVPGAPACGPPSDWPPDPTTPTHPIDAPRTERKEEPP